MKNRVLILSLVSSMFFSSKILAADVNLTGARASFPAPIYAKWADSYNKKLA